MRLNNHLIARKSHKIVRKVKMTVEISRNHSNKHKRSIKKYKKILIHTQKVLSSQEFRKITLCGLLKLPRQEDLQTLRDVRPAQWAAFAAGSTTGTCEHVGTGQKRCVHLVIHADAAAHRVQQFC